MTQIKEIDGKKYLSARSASKLVGYSSDYVTRLARQGKIDAERIENQWFVEPESLKLFTLNAEAEKRNRKEKLREERLSERSESLRHANEEVLISQMNSARNSSIAQTAILTACLFLLLNIFWFSYESKLNTTALFGGLSEIGSLLSDAVIEPIPEFVSQVASFAFVQDLERNSDLPETLQVEQDSSGSDQSDFQGIVLFGEEEGDDEYIENVRESFSDEVQVDFDSEDSGVITPVFKERDGESYRFLLVPVKPPGD